jgi:nicotinamidase-related amidase
MSTDPLAPGNPVVVCIDVQHDFLSRDQPDEGAPTPDIPARLENILRVVSTARAHDVPVVFIQEIHKPSLIDIGRELDGAEGVHCLEGQPQTELIPGLDPRPEEYLIRKRRYSAFFGTELHIVLKGLRADSLILIGGLSDVCVHLTAADAHQHDFHIRVVTDAIAGSSQTAHDAAIAAMTYLQTRAPVITDAVCEYFTARAPTAAPASRER